MLLVTPSSVSAHGGAYLVLEPNIISPDGVGSVRGAGFGAAETVALVLVMSTGEVPLGTAETDGEGSFSAVIRLPPDAAPGSARLEARSADHVESVGLTVADAASDDEGEGRRDEEEPLLAPLPSPPSSTTPPYGAPSVAATASQPADPASAAGAPSAIIVIAAAIATIVAAIGGVLAVRQRRGRRVATHGRSSE